ncbi:Crossover junction endonuclease mus81 [Lambiella insularis]|nr:Crossover junction endonuclease mus81 [Lambiella insularis]
MLALSTLPEHSSSGLTKAQTIEIAQPHCDASFSAPSDPTKFYTAWESMKTLQSKELVYEMGRPTKKYALTEEGWEIAKNIRATTNSAELPAIGRDVGNGTKRTKIVDPADDPDEESEIDRAIRASREDQTARAQTNSRSSRTETAAPKPGTPSAVSQQLPSANYYELLSSPAADRSHNSRSLAMPSTETQTSRTKKNEVHPDSHASSRKKSNESQNNAAPFQALRIAPGAFTVELVLDNREVRSKTDRDYIQDELRNRGVCPIVRPLDLGDATWVAKCKDSRLLSSMGEEGDEIILDWIVERKRLDDLVGSIKDGRFQEQKFRMHKSGIKNVIYIVEEITMSLDATQRYHEHVMSAIASTQVVNGYFVKRTRKLDDTIRYLARMTMMLKSLYEVTSSPPPPLNPASLTPPQSKPLLLIPSDRLSPTTYLPLLSSLSIPHNITYPSFAALVSKSDSLTVRDIFLKMLMCTRGITGDKAMEIQKHWPTPLAFVEALEECGEGDGLGTDRDELSGAARRRDMVWKAAGGLVGPRKIGKAVSAKVGDVWGEG